MTLVLKLIMNKTSYIKLRKIFHVVFNLKTFLYYFPYIFLIAARGNRNQKGDLTRISLASSRECEACLFTLFYLFISPIYN